MKKLLIILFITLFSINSYANSFGLDDAKKAKITTEIIKFISKDKQRKGL
jgi:hypothetical protein